MISEILPPFLLGLLAFTVILLIARILKLIEMVVTRGVPFVQIGKLFALILPTFLEITVPMALLIGVFLGLGRLAKDQEIVALKATGISPRQILVPLGALALVVSLATLLLTTLLRPEANLALKRELYNIAKSRVGTALREKVFNDDFPGVLMYAEEVIPPGNTCQGVLIVDRRNPTRETVILSRLAIITSDEESKTVSLKLYDGTAYEREKNETTFSQTHFNLYDFKLDFDEALNPAQRIERGPKEMSLGRLLRAINQKEQSGKPPTEELMELHQRFSFSFAPLVLSLLAISIALLPKRSGGSRSWGLFFCLCWFLVYYVLFSLGKALGNQKVLPPGLSLWLPNIVVGLVALYLFRKALHESPLFVQTQLENFSFRLNQRFARFRQRS